MPILSAPKLQPDANDPTGGKLPEFRQWSMDDTVLGGKTGQQSADIFNSIHAAQNNTPSVNAPTQSPLAKSIYQNSLGAATDYSKNIKSYSDSLYNTLAGQTTQGLAKTDRGIRSSYNSRGLLNSGMERGAEAAAGAGASQNLSAGRAQINQGLLSGLQGLQSNAFGNATALAQPGVQTAQTDLAGLASNIGTQTKNSELANAIYSNLGQGVGGLAGLGVAGAFKPTDYSKIYEDVYMNGK